MDQDRLKKKLDDAYSCAKQGDYADALGVCSSLLEQYPDSMSEILRTRSHIYAHMESLQDALNDRRTIIGSGKAEIKDYYFASQFSIELQLYQEAISLLRAALGLGEANDDSRYEQAARFLLAFSCLKVGRYDEAKSECAHIEDNYEMWIEGHGLITKADILRQVS